MKDYGVRVYRQGVDFKQDRRPRDYKGEAFVIPLRLHHASQVRRGAISGLSKMSARRLEFIAANVATALTTILTLTYRENAGEGESDEQRNYRVAKRSKLDLNRFLTCVRLEVGGYLWVQEFQQRGVVHYHVLCEKPITEQRARIVWCRATGALGDEAALRYAVKVEAISNPVGARSYVGRYMGKERQKSLPPGVSGAGRWWGNSRGLQLDLVTEVIACAHKAQQGNFTEIWVQRQLRRYLTRVFGRKFKGGFFVNWGGHLTDALSRMTGELRQWFMDYVDRETGRARKLVEKHGWEFVGEVGGEDAVGVEDVDVPVQLDLDRESYDSARARWAKLREGRPKPRRGMWGEYFPVVEGFSPGTAGAGPVAAGVSTGTESSSPAGIEISPPGVIN